MNRQSLYNIIFGTLSTESLLWRFLPRVGMALLVGAVFVLASHTAVQAQDAEAAPSHAVIDIEAPAQVEAGSVIPLTLRLQEPANVDGFEAYLRFDPEAAIFAGFAPRQPQGETGLGRLLLPELTTGSAVGFYTCTTGPCLQQREVQVQAASAENEATLAVVELLPLVEGALQVNLGHVVAVDAHGNPLEVTLVQESITIQVGAGEAQHPAPGDNWPERPQPTQIAAEAAIEQADVTRSGTVSHADVMEVAMEWHLAREGGNPCEFWQESADINRDGCIDVVDVQLAAAFAQQPVDQPAQQPEDVQPAQEIEQLTFVVNSTLDEGNADVGNGECLTESGVCTLRAAIAEANAQEGMNTILFDIPGEGIHTIQLSSRLPSLNDESGGTRIDGYSQPGAAPNTDPRISNAEIRIEVRGQGSEGFDGLVITSTGNEVRGIAFYDLKRPMWIFGPGAQENIIAGNFIGTNAPGDFRFTMLAASQSHGMHIEQGAHNNRIGGTEPEDRNVISGNARHGVGFWHVGTDHNRVLNNLVGLSPDAQRSLPNKGHGVDFNFGASQNILGGTEPGERNVLSGNNWTGAEISHGENTTQNHIIGNYIGTDTDGDTAHHYTANGRAGVSLQDRVRNNLVTHNVIANNRGGGIFIDDFGNCCTSNNVLEENRIGIGAEGNVLPNDEFGVRVQGTQTRVGPGNIIAYNPIGIQVVGEHSSGNTITLNSIFDNIGLGIDLEPLNLVNDSDSTFPTLQEASPSEITGTTCGDCRIEIFITDRRSLYYGQGKTYVGSGTSGEDGAYTAALENVEYGDYLTATATDAEGNTSEFSQNIMVRDLSNQPPIVVDVVASTYEETPVTIDVLADASDPEGDELFIAGVDVPENGEAFTNGSYVTYSPNPTFLGTDSFDYTVSDGRGGDSTATITVTVEEFTGTGQSQVMVLPTEMMLIEGGSPKSYTIALGAEPTDVVTITLNLDDGAGGLFTNRITVDRSEIVFDVDNWDVPQSVEVTAVRRDAAVRAQAPEAEAESAAIDEPDASEEATTRRTIVIRHQVLSADTTYQNLGLPSITVNVIDEDNPFIFVPLLMR